MRERLKNPVSEADAVNYARQIAEALQVVHAAGVVHRDLKPSNIMLTTDNRVVLIDFGSARGQLVNNDLSRSDLQTGTPYYVCPEQIAGNHPDQRADLYSSRYRLLRDARRQLAVPRQYTWPTFSMRIATAHRRRWRRGAGALSARDRSRLGEESKRPLSVRRPFSRGIARCGGSTTHKTGQAGPHRGIGDMISALPSNMHQRLTPRALAALSRGARSRVFATILLPGFEMATELANTTAAIKFVAEHQRYPDLIRTSLESVRDRLATRAYTQEPLDQLRDAVGRSTSAAHDVRCAGERLVQRRERHDGICAARRGQACGVAACAVGAA
jgi:hypothetical protein